MSQTSGAAGGGIVTAALLVIGDEILSGRTQDTNIGYIAEHLDRHRRRPDRGAGGRRRSRTRSSPR